MKLFKALQLLLFPTTEQKAIAQRIKKFKTLKVGNGVLMSVDAQEILEAKPTKPHFMYRHGCWSIDNFTQCLKTTTLNSKERWYVHQALAWLKRMNIK